MAFVFYSDRLMRVINEDGDEDEDEGGDGGEMTMTNLGSMTIKGSCEHCPI